MAIRPRPGDTLTISDIIYTFLEHPVSPGMAYGQSGRRGTVYQLQAQDSSLWALKVFLRQYREPRLAGQAEQIAGYAALPGLRACKRTVLSASRYLQLIQEYPDLDYAILMPWVEGRTWAEITMGSEPLAPEEALKRSCSLAAVLLSMEERSLAHCDLSGPNLILPSSGGVELVDLEEMFGTQLVRPEALPGGSPGYAHKTAPQGHWNSKADRFSGAVLLAEMLGWASEPVHRASWGEGYFAPDEMGSNCERFQLLRETLKQSWGDRIAEVFHEAWFSDTLAQCPTFSQWLSSLPEEVPVRDAVSAAVPDLAEPAHNDPPADVVPAKLKTSTGKKRSCPICGQDVSLDLTICPFCENEIAGPGSEAEPAPVVPKSPQAVVPDDPAAARKGEPGHGKGRRWIYAVGGLVALAAVAAVILPTVLNGSLPADETSGLDPSITQFTIGTAESSSPEIDEEVPTDSSTASIVNPVLIPTASMPEEEVGRVVFIRFPVDRAPYDDVNFRQALACAVDREALAVELGNQYDVDFQPASTFTLPEVLGADLSGEIGFDYHPDAAVEALAAAGYSSPGYSSGAEAPFLELYKIPAGITSTASELVLSMWKDALGVGGGSVDTGSSEDQMTADRLTLTVWGPDYPDPYSYLHDAVCGTYLQEFYATEQASALFNEIISSKDWGVRAQAVRSYSDGICGGAWDPPLRASQQTAYLNYLDQGLDTQDMEQRIEWYLRAERMLLEQDTAVIPLVIYYVDN